MANIEENVDVSEEIKRDVLILKLHGRLDAITSPAVERKVFDYINNGKHKLLLEFSGVEYLSSAGMRMLLSTAKKLKSLNGRLIVCCIVPNVMDVLRMSGFDHVLELSKSEEEALQRF